MTQEEELALLEAGGADAEATLKALREQWAKEDREMIAARQAITAAHAQGARDRDRRRVELGGVSKLEGDVPEPESYVLPTPPVKTLPAPDVSADQT